jgi:hypothetical protein
LDSLCIALRLQLRQSGLSGVQGQLQGHAALHQPIRRIGLLHQRVADQAFGQSVFGEAALLAQGGQKLLELVAFLGGHEQVPSWITDGLTTTIMGSRIVLQSDGPMHHQVFCRYT